MLGDKDSCFSRHPTETALKKYFYQIGSPTHFPAKMTNICPVMITSKKNLSTGMLRAIGSLCLLLLTSCGGDKEAIVQQQVAERVVAFKVKKNAECREALLDTAERTVDSLVLTEAQDALNDSLARLRPGRPFQPAVIPPIDSLKVKPIFDGIRPASGTRG